MSILLTILFIWIVFFLLLKVIEVLTTGALSHGLKARNITLKFCYFSVHTTYFNAPLKTFAYHYRRPLKKWFSYGVYFGRFGLLLSLSLLVLNLIPSAFFMPLNSKRALSEPIFSPGPRIPFFHNHGPWWLPDYFTLLFVPKDHHSSALGPPFKSHTLYATTNRVYSYSHSRSIRRRYGNRYRHRRRRHRGCVKFHDKLRLRRKYKYHSHMPPWLGNERPQNQLPPKYKPPSQEILHITNRQLEPPIHPLSHAVSRHGRSLLQQQQQRQFPSSLANDTHPSSTLQFQDSYLTPLVPGVTIPAGDIWYMFLAIALAAFVHELGHALAAAMQNRPIIDMGAFLALVLPGAYVRLANIGSMPPNAQLRVYCAGAWHNVTSAMLSLLLVAILPSLMGVFYVTSAGSLVVSVPDHSPLFGHVSTGDVLLRVGKFDVVNGGQSFRSAVEDLIRSNDSVGFCVGKTRTQEMDITKGACCEKGFQKTNTQASLQCFRTTEEDKKGFCLNPSLISMRPTCRVSADCKGGLLPSLKQGSEGFIGAGRQVSVSDGMEKMKGVKDDICLLAELPNNQQLVDLRVRAAENGNIMHVFYQGYGKIVGSMTVSSYVPRLWRWMPTWLLEMVAMLDFPNMTERFLQYFASVSLALGLLNMAPVLYLDGEASSRLFLQMACGSRKANPSLNRGIVMLGTSLLLANVAHALWKITKLV